MTLHEAYALYGTHGGGTREPYTDKGPPCHSYIAWYESRLAAFQHTAEHVVEFGVESSYRSLLLWREYFHRAHIWGLDVRKFNIDEPRITFRHRSCLEGPDDDMPPFDVVVDDASHDFADQVVAWQRWRDHVKPGGLYIIEDVSHDLAMAWFQMNRFEVFDFLRDGRKDDRLVCWTRES